MKKLTALTIAIIMTLCLMSLTACGNDDGSNQANNSAPTSASESEKEPESELDWDEFNSKSASLKPSASQGTQTSSQEPTQSSSDGNSSDQGGGSSSPSVPSYDVYTPTESDFEYQTPKINGYVPNFDKGYEYTLVIYAINDLKTPNLTDPFYNGLEDIKNQYAKLSSEDKAQVDNYSRYEEARAQVDKLLKIQAEYIIENLTVPEELSQSTLTAFGAQVTAINKALDRITDANTISNLSVYRTKKSQAEDVIAGAFDTAVAALEPFEFSDEYKKKLDDAFTLYEIVKENGLTTRVATSYATLTQKLQQYNDHASSLGFIDLLATLPDDASTITDADKASIISLQKTYNKMTAGEKAELPAEAVNKFNALVQEMRSRGWEAKVCNLGSNPSGDDFFKVYKNDSKKSASSLGQTSNGEQYPAVYDDEVYYLASKHKTDRLIEFTTANAGVLTIAANNKGSDASFTITGPDGYSQTITIVAHDKNVTEGTEYVLELPSAGTYTMTANAEYLIFVIAFN